MNYLSCFVLFSAISVILCHPGHITGIKGGRSEPRNGSPTDNQGGHDQEGFQENQGSGNPGHQHGIKSYGGYFHDHNNFRHTHAYHQQQQPNYYQPYGWNQYQPSRTYGGVIPQNYPGNPQGFGWFGQGAGWGNQYGHQDNRENNGNDASDFPKVPSLFVPGFNPPAYFGGQPYSSLPNLFPNMFGPNQGGVPQGGNGQPQGGHGPNRQPPYPTDGNHGPHYPQANNQHNQGPNQHNQGPNQQPTGNDGPNQYPQSGNHGSNVVPLPQHSQHEQPNQYPASGNQQGPGFTITGMQQGQTQSQGQFQESQNENTQNRVQTDDQFLTNAFFGTNNEVNREWTQEDETKWQATTKAPYFENKVPGLECTLPASAVLGATTALKASSLLPLNVPVGKPILSCNATQLLQAQINLNGIIYDCDRSAITMSCPRLDANRNIVDECLGETLECDVRMQSNSKSVSCTNGTLISNADIVCKSATLQTRKNVLNCQYKTGREPIYTHGPSTRRPTATQRPVVVPQTSLAPPPVVENPDEDTDLEDRFNGIDNRGGSDRPVDSLDLLGGVRYAMNQVFPSELLSIPETQKYLPPSPNSGPRHIPTELRNTLTGVFPSNLFAMSHTSELDDNSIENSQDSDSGLSVGQQQTTRDSQSSFTESRRPDWDIDAGKKGARTGTFIKTSNAAPPKRSTSLAPDTGDRHIFSP